MRVAKKDMQSDISPFDAGRLCFIMRRPVDVGLRLAGVSYKMVDQTASFLRGYERERLDCCELVAGGEIEEGEESVDRPDGSGPPFAL